MILPLILLETSLLRAHDNNDSIIMHNGNIVVGEIKKLEQGVIEVETDYSKDDFRIEWSGIRRIFSKSNFLITLQDGRRLNGGFESMVGTGKAIIHTPEGDSIEVRLDDIVFLRSLKSDFWGRMKLNIDIGMSLAKANNLRQFSTRNAASYLADRWHVDVYFNSNLSGQDSIASTKRTDAGIQYQYYLPDDWFLAASVTFLSNTEQALKLRTSGKLGGGKMIVHTNKKYWGAGAGFSVINEVFSNEIASRNSMEAYLGSELNLFDIGDLNLLSTVYVYKGITEGQRWRCDFKLDIKYDLPFDFYLKPGINFNYDNQPAVSGKDFDYVFLFNIGWEL
jgi:hypothetical protein